MGVFSRFAIRSLKRNRTRTAVSLLGVVLSCALVCAVLTSAASMNAMLAERTLIEEGAWQAELVGVTPEGLERLDADERVARHLETTELGCVELGDENAQWYGDYLFAKTWPLNPEGTAIAAEPEIVSGQAPSAPGEVVLPHYLEGVELEPCGLEATGPLQVGSRVTFQLGTRTATSLEDGSSFTATSAFGTYVPEDDYDVAFEQNLGTMDAQVVGFYRAWGYSSTMAAQGNTALLYPEDGMAAAAASDASDATLAYSLVCTNRPQQAEELAEEYAAEGLATEGSQTHTSLLRWQGVRGTSATWNALYQIAGVLAVVIVVAGVSLVHNSFAISVAERTRQFGLLSSLGASKRQLRRSVLAEALVLAAVGIPCGLALGLAGCWVVFKATGAGMAAMFGGDAYGIAAHVVASPLALGVAAALSLLTVLVSAWIPALRASRVSAIDAIRQAQDVRLSRRASRRAARQARRGGDGVPRPRGLAGRLFGVPGYVAQRNLSRSSSKGRVTVAALAVSVALLICTGLIGETLGYASGTALDTMGDVDLEVRVDATAVEGEDGSELMSDEGLYDNVAVMDALSRLYADCVQEVGDEASLGYYARFVTDVIVPAEMSSPTQSSFFGTELPDGSWTAPIYVSFVDDATWRDYVRELGLDEERFCDAAHPLAVALNSYEISEGNGGYGSRSPLAGPGEVQTLTYATDVPGTEGMFAGGLTTDEDGELGVWYSMPDGSSELFVPADEAVDPQGGIEVGALADEAPAGISTRTSTMTLLLPASAIGSVPAVSFGDACMNYTTSGDAEATSRLQDALAQVAASHPELDCVYTNYAQSKAQARLMSDTIQTFIWCFTAVCALIAVANVFNTLTNSLILRRREFAVLRSVGMGEHQFRRMIVLECASYAVRGLAIGLVLAAIIAVALNQAMGDAFSTFSIGIPWAQVALSCALVLGVLGLSVAYALVRSKGSNVVESLRADAI